MAIKISGYKVSKYKFARMAALAYLDILDLKSARITSRTKLYSNQNVLKNFYCLGLFYSIITLWAGPIEHSSH